MKTLRTLVCLTLALTFTTQGCSASGMEDGKEEDATATKAIWPQDASKLVVERKPVYLPAGAAGSTCKLGFEKYTVHVAEAKMEWSKCSPGSDGVAHLVNGTAMIRAKLDAIVLAAKALKETTNAPCGADKPYITVEVTTPRGANTYVDSFYACSSKGMFVDNVDGILGALRLAVP